MKILILGATGRTGKWILTLALQKGFCVHVIVRDRSKITLDENLTVFEGTPADRELLSKAAEHCDAIVGVLNISRTSDFPWAPLRTPKTFLSEVMKNCLHVASDVGIRRIVVCSAWGVSETVAYIPFWFRWMIQYSNIGVAYKDHERQEKLLMASGLDWTIVRPVGLTNSKKIQNIRVSYKNKPKPKLTISRKSVAEFMLNALEADSLIGKLPVIFAE